MPNALMTACRSIILVAAFAAASAFAQQEERPFSTLEERMTGKEFKAAGLHKLSDEELAALNEWIRARSLTLEEARSGTTGAAAPAAGETASAAGDRRGFPGSSDESSPIRTRIDGPFEGWSGNTEFVLENGMVWEQTGSGSFYMPEADSPEVVIRPGMFGSWYLSVEGYNQEVAVRRVE
jgi:hypothetical protein